MNTISVRRGLGGLGCVSAIFALVALVLADDPAQPSLPRAYLDGTRAWLAVAGRGRFREREL